jgi:hypothetical protein
MALHLGNCTSFVTEYTFTNVTTAHTITASFAIDTSTLTITGTGTGTGVVTSAPAGIDCGATCSADYDFGSDVTLTAMPVKGSVFKGWTGEDCTGTENYTVTRNEQKEISASFERSFPWPMFLPIIINNGK